MTIIGKVRNNFFLIQKRFGDDADRALLKPNGEITYFMTDILYHLDKIDRKFDTLVNIWGADHFGYVKRLKGAINNLSKKNFLLRLNLLL